jgi:hypothetical protein
MAGAGIASTPLSLFACCANGGLPPLVAIAGAAVCIASPSYPGSGGGALGSDVLDSEEAGVVIVICAPDAGAATVDLAFRTGNADFIGMRDFGAAAGASALALVSAGWRGAADDDVRRRAMPLRVERAGSRSLSAAKKARCRELRGLVVVVAGTGGLLWKPSAGSKIGEVELPDKNSGANLGERDCKRGRALEDSERALTSGRYMHVKLCSEGLETITEGDVAEDFSGSGSMRRHFSLARECPLPIASHSSELPFTVVVAGGCNRSVNVAAGFVKTTLFDDKDSAEHVTTILGSVWPSSRASFSSSSSILTISSGSPLAGTRRLQRRPSASQISWTKIVPSDACSRRRLNRCGAGAAEGSTGTMDARRKSDDERVLLGLSSLLEGGEESMLSKWKGSSSSLSVGGDRRRVRLQMGGYEGSAGQRGRSEHLLFVLGHCTAPCGGC